MIWANSVVYARVLFKVCDRNWKIEKIKGRLEARYPGNVAIDFGCGALF
jgi:hypothetical protein